MYRRIAIVLALALSLMACSEKPADSVINQEVSAYLTANERGKIYEVTNLKKLNGIPRDKNTYIAEMSYDLRFRVGVEDAPEALQGNSGSIFAAGMSAMELVGEFGSFKKGDTVRREGQFRFIRTEKGWRIGDEK